MLGSQEKSNLIVKYARSEYRRNPLGIDEEMPRLSWVVESECRCQKQSAYRIVVGSDEAKLRECKGDLWDTGKVTSSESSVILYKGKKLESFQRCYWKVMVWDEQDRPSGWSGPAWWETAVLDEQQWEGKWISEERDEPEGEEGLYKDEPARLFRKEFDIEKPVKSARLCITGLGYYEAFINGYRTGYALLAPSWTSYGKRVFYNTYDVTKQLSQGINCVGAVLGNGWYNPLSMRMWGWLNLREHLVVGSPRLVAILRLEYKDGTVEVVGSDKSWEVTEGPILRNNVYLGEVYDARLEISGWSRPGVKYGNWRRAKEVDGPGGKLCAEPMEPIRETSVLKPVEINEPQPNVYVFDMGCNFAGCVRLRLRGRRGTKVKLKYGELLNEDGTVNVMTSVCGQIKSVPSEVTPEGVKGSAGSPAVAYQSDTYIAKGEQEEIRRPRFTYHGFRYVEVEGYPGKPDTNALEGVSLNSDVRPAGSFSCSNEMFNSLQEMVKRTFLSNLHGLQTDCPHREKFCYGGDIVATAEAFMLNFDMSSLYEKIVYDFGDARRPDGGLTECAPYNGIADGGLGGGAGPVGWGTVHPLLLRALYRYYGNRELIGRQYSVARDWLEFLRENAKEHFIEVGLSDHESIDEKPVALTSTAFYYYNARLLAELAGILGRRGDVNRYGKLAGQIKRAFVERFLKRGTGEYDIGTQACQAFALYLDLVPDEEKKAAAEVMVSEVMNPRVREIKSEDGEVRKVLNKPAGHISAGIFGTRYLLGVLANIGRSDVAYLMTNQRDFPGWGYMLERGATTLWEHWAYSDNTFSHNHPMFGSLSEWFFKALAGIFPAEDAKGFDKIVIRPQVVGDLTWAKGRYESVRGTVVSEWNLAGEKLSVGVRVPANCVAKVIIPAVEAENVTEGGARASEADGVRFTKEDNGTAVFEVLSGMYNFVSEPVKAKSVEL